MPKVIKNAILLVAIASTAAAGSQQFVDSTTTFGEGLNPNNNPANGPGLVVTEDFMIAGDQQGNSWREGVVHVWVKVNNQWVYSQTLVDHGPNANTNAGWFGYCLDFDGDWLAVGGTNDLGPYGQGDVQMFKLDRSTGRFEFAQYLQDTEVRMGDEFGDTLSMNGNWLVIGAPWHDHNGMSDSGAAWFYELEGGTTWVKRQIVVSQNIAAGHQFGIAVEVHGIDAFITSYDNAGGYQAGTVYRFQLTNGNQWLQTGSLKPEVVLPAATFGQHVQCTGDRLVVTAPMKASSYSIGSVYFFERTNGIWKQVNFYTPQDLAPKTYFGTSLAFQGDMAVVGTKYADDKRGKAHVFHRDYRSGKWELMAILAPPERVQGDMFGTDVWTDGHDVYCVSSGAWRNAAKTNVLYTFRGPKPTDGTPSNQPGSFGKILLNPLPYNSLSVHFVVPPAMEAQLQSSHDTGSWTATGPAIPAGEYWTRFPFGSEKFFRVRRVAP